jgi:stalled ribosome rescue protein Dom34
MVLYESGNKEASAKAILELDDDIYFLRYMLKYGKGLLADLTRPTAAKMLKQMLSINKTHFMEQLLLKLATETAKSCTGVMLTTQQTLSIT